MPTLSHVAVGLTLRLLQFLNINFRRPLNLVGPPMPPSPSLFTSATITTGSEYAPLQNCLLPLSFRPGGCCSRLHQHFRHFFFRVTSHEHGACPPHLYTFVYCHTPCRRSDLQVPFFSNGFLYTVPFLLSLTTPFSVK
jgi:hypothetical protein